MEDFKHKARILQCGLHKLTANILILEHMEKAMCVQLRRKLWGKTICQDARDQSPSGGKSNQLQFIKQVCLVLKQGFPCN